MLIKISRPHLEHFCAAFERVENRVDPDSRKSNKARAPKAGRSGPKPNMG